MPFETRRVYYDDAYQTELHATILHIDEEDGKLLVYLDATIFYPYGGGQPADQGTLATATGQAEVRNVLNREQGIQHICHLTAGTLEAGQAAALALDWPRRHLNMRVHTAGHIIHDVLMEMVEGLTPGRGDHGSKPFIEYNVTGEIAIDENALETAVNAEIAGGREVVTRETSLDELRQLAQMLPPGIERFPRLRMIQIEGYYAMPDGGTQVRNINEIGRVEIVSIAEKSGKLRLDYRVHATN